jgi:toxin-antitoxin system PIN domain toxin
MKPSLFPDVNVWFALTHSRHVHHEIAASWFQRIEQTMFFCRFTQLGLLRLLTQEKIMGIDVMNQRQAWQAYRRWFEDSRIEFHREPEVPEFESLFEQWSSRPRPSPKLWADAYLAAFARAAGLTLVTFDRDFQRMATLDAQILSAG